jgi:predicted acylesterase/phospholipase RssA
MFTIKSSQSDFPKNSGKKYKVIINSGGGLFGYIITNFMSYLNFDIRKHINVFAGTSIGGILAIAYSLFDNYQEINNIFKVSGPDIFSKKNLLRIIGGPKYNNKNLKKLLKQLFGERRLSDINDINLIITSTDYTLNQPRIFENINLKPEQNFLLCDVGLCTSAAPTFFPAQEIKWQTLNYNLKDIPLNEKILLLSANEHKNIINYPDFNKSSIIFDGGLLENIPIISTYTTLHNELGVEPKDLDVFVIGTGNSIRKEYYSLNEINKWSVFKILTNLIIPYTTNSNEQTSIFWGLQMGFNSFTYFNPINIEGNMDDISIMTEIENQCLNNKNLFLKEISEFLKK